MKSSLLTFGLRGSSLLRDGLGEVHDFRFEGEGIVEGQREVSGNGAVLETVSVADLGTCLH